MTTNQGSNTDNSHSSATGDKTFSELLADGTHLLHLFGHQFQTTYQLAEAEVKLSLRCLFLGMMASLFFAGLGLSAWMLAVFGIGWYLHEWGLPLYILIPGLIAVQVILLLWCKKLAKEAFNRISLGHTARALAINLNQDPLNQDPKSAKPESNDFAKHSSNTH